ncbi:TPA: hypothetical protein ACH3X1_016428 [Trebouxia sp. C0004]
MARIGTLERNQAASQQLRSDMLQTQTELAATRTELLKAQSELTAACSDLAEFKNSVNKRLGEQTSHSVARETAVKMGCSNSRPADLTRYVSNKLDIATPRRGSPSQALSQSIRAVSHIGRPGSGKRAVLVEFSTHTAKHEAFKLSPHLRRLGLHLADELTPKQLKAQKGLEADFSALKLKGFRPFYRRGELKYRDQGVNRTCKRGEAIRVSAPISPPRAFPAPPGPPPRGPALGRQGARTSLPGHPSPGSTAGGGPAPGQSAAAASTSAAIAAANAATTAAANAMAGDGDTGMPAPSPGSGAGPSQ